MEVVKINDLSIRLDSSVTYYEIDDLFFGYPIIKAEFFDINMSIFHRILFLGFPASSTEAKNINVVELRKLNSKVKGNNALQSIFALINNAYEFDYFFIATSGIDPVGIDFLKKLPTAFKELDKKLFIIGSKKITTDFKINESTQL